MTAKFPEKITNEHEAVVNSRRRLAALAQTGLVDTLPEEAFDRAVRLATRLTGTPVALFSLVDATRQFFKAQTGLSAEVATSRETPLSHSFCQYVVSQDSPLAVSDARRHPLLRDNLAVPELDVIAYLGVPVHGPGGETLGSICAIDSNPHEWTEETGRLWMTSRTYWKRKSRFARPQRSVSCFSTNSITVSKTSLPPSLE